MRRLILGVMALAIGLAATGIFLLYRGAESYYLRHQRAYQLWTSRHPTHYSYTVVLLGDMMHQTFGVEVDQGRLIRLTDVITGLSMTIPPTASTSFLPANAWLRNNLLIDDMFIHIKVATKPPTTVESFLVRATPAMYQRFARIGWLPVSRPTCEPDYPQVLYHPVYGYPEKLYLAGNPCTNDDEAVPVRLRIEDFVPLP